MDPDRKRLDDLKARYDRLYQEFWSDQVLTRAEQTQLESIQKLIREIDKALAARGDVAEQGEPGGRTVEATTSAGTVESVPRQWDPGEDLSERNADELFEETYMDDVMDSRPPGSDSDELNGAMEALLENPDGSHTDQYLQIIATETGMTLQQAKAEYRKFQAIQQQAQNAAASNPDDDIDNPEMLEEKHRRFLGTTASLRYGKMVGDHFGINPVFGAMLNPTGGMVGPGNTQLYDGDPDDPIVKHGVAHDAAGYLKNYHDAGPGYDYLKQETHRDTTDPYVGQQSGIQYWLDKDGRDDLESDVLREMMDKYGEGLDTLREVQDGYEQTEKALKAGYDWANEKIDEYQDWRDERQEEAEEAVGKAWDELTDLVGDKVDEAREKVRQTVDEAEQEVDDFIDERKQDVEDAVDELEEKKDEILNDVREVRDAVEEEVDRRSDEAVDWISDKASDAADTARDAAEAGFEAVDGAKQYADTKLEEAGEYWDSLWD